MSIIRPGDPAHAASIRRQWELLANRVRYHSIELPDGRVLPGLQSIAELKQRIAVFGLPEDLSGKRVLDIGAWDGWFSFEMERRGAEVVALDCVPFDTFLEARGLLGSKVEYRILDVDEISPAALGTFDIVLFFGVLYHLRHPLLGLEKVLSVTRDTALVESFVAAADPAVRHRACLEFYETTELGGQLDNWYGPTPECLLALCRSAGFAQVTWAGERNQRASVVCRRRWPAPPPDPLPAPLLRTVTNNRDYESRFHTGKDEYLLCFFRSGEQAIARDELYVEVDGLGTPALIVSRLTGNEWQANCLRPPDLKPGAHEVRIRTRASAPSNPVEVLMDAPEDAPLPEPGGAEAPRITLLDYNSPKDLRYTDRGEIDCYFTSPERPTVSNTAALLDGRPCRVKSILCSEEGYRAKLKIPEWLAPGEHAVRIRTARSAFSGAVSIKL
jgi:tRNA (mo5U34)-methyltransferase